MAQVEVTLSVKAKWWMWPALRVSSILLRLGLIRGAASAEHYGGRITAEQRVAKWLADHAFRFGVR
jgi:hypothetical protein